MGAGAAAAVEYDYPGAIDPASIVVSTVDGSPGTGVNEQIRIDATWSVPDGASAGQTFGFTLPTEFARLGTSFVVPSTDDPATPIAHCTVSADAAPVVTCTLTDYVEGRNGIAGSLWFVASADESTESSTVEFVVDGKTTPVTVPGGGITPGKTLPAEPQKWSSLTDDGRIEWVLVIPGAQFIGAESIVVDDVLTPAGETTAAHHNTDGQVTVWATDETNGPSYSVPGWTAAWNEDGTAFHLEIPAPIDASRYYMVKYYTEPAVPSQGATFANVATINGTTVRDTQVWTSAGGGIGDGTPMGGFAITKAIDGDAASTVPTDAEFTVRYTYGDPAVTETVSFTTANVGQSIRLPQGTVVILEEVDIPAVDGVEWGTPTFTGPGVVALDGGRAQITIGAYTDAAVTLTNSARVVTPPPPTPTQPPTPTPTTPGAPPELPLTETLATTGSDLPLPLLYAGAAVVLLGLALTTRAAVLRRRR
ncbi:hypothetical protein AB663_002295 [Microbacterium sp. XT11]|nr:hypothetical protein AB663_002295 [Microbacterium sp. XT11]